MMMNTTLLRGGTSLSGSSATCRVVLRFKKVQLLHEVSDYGYIEGEVVSDGDTNKRLLQDIVQDGNMRRVVRILDLAYERVVGLLSPLTDSAIGEEEERDDVPDDRTDYEVVLHVGSDFTKERVDRLTSYIHNYMVYYTLYHWLSITNADAADKWLLQAETLAESIRDARFVGGMYHRPYRPF